MYSSPLENSAAFLVQSGIVAWEDPYAVSHWQSKTLTVCTSGVERLSEIVQEMRAADLIKTTQLFRWHVLSGDRWQNQLQKQKLTRILSAGSPGFGEAIVAETNGAICSLARSSDVDQIDLRHLSSYRDTLMIATDASMNVTELQELLSSFNASFDTRSLVQLRDALPSFMLFRTLELERESVLQVIANAASVAPIVAWLEERGATRVTDRKELVAAIMSWK